MSSFEMTTGTRRGVHRTSVAPLGTGLSFATGFRCGRTTLSCGHLLMKPSSPGFFASVTLKKHEPYNVNE